ncbi:MAG TPA: hypothetical protein VMP12_03680 [Candidatus Sulfotelmatobacter sp.]|nr:hypothetical protein [Candidatus Sulfotelmatobacter sp.]
MDHRLAFLALVVLLIGAGTPLAFAWVRLLPEDAPPFPIEPGSFPSVDDEVPQERPNRKKDYWIAAPLVFCLTIAFVFRVPGFPSATVLAWVGGTIPGVSEHWSVIAIQVVVALIAIGAAVFGALRPGPLRIPLIFASATTLILWFLGPLLQTAMLAGA